MENLKPLCDSFADILGTDESERIELIDGKPYMMAPPKRMHQQISMELSRQFSNFLDGKPCKVFAAPFGVRPFEEEGDAPEEVDTLVEPDITVVCDPKKLDEYGCKGAPDLIIEILSDSTRRHDRLTKYQLYEKAGVKEYWIVDPEQKLVLVHLLDETGRYGASEVYLSGAQVPVSLWEGFSVDLDRVFEY